MSKKEEVTLMNVSSIKLLPKCTSSHPQVTVVSKVQRMCMVDGSHLRSSQLVKVWRRASQP